MKKNSKKETEKESSMVNIKDDLPTQDKSTKKQDTDTKILIQISKRKDENLALKKLLDNLHTISPKTKK